MKSVFLYSDEGACPSNVRSTLAALEENGQTSIVLANRATFLEQGWEEVASMVIFPGGRDAPYAAALRNEPNRRIREYVSRGGRYFGICAGAYYAADSIVFEKGHPLEITGKRALRFFPGPAIGPALGLGQFSYDDERGAQVIRLSISNEPLDAYYNGGCYFADAAAFPSVSVLALFEEINEAAIVLCQVGKGRALLSGVHPEHPLSNKRLFSSLLQQLS